MNPLALSLRTARPLAVLTLAALAALTSTAYAATGQLRGKVTNAENAEPVSLAAVQLLPSDASMKKTGAMTNSDGTYAITAEEGTYTVRVLAQGFGAKDVSGVVITAGAVQEVNVVIGVRAIQQQEIVVTADVKKSSESALLAARKKAPALGDAVSAEQIKKNPDSNVAQALARVTGLNIHSHGHVFVRGMGERYSSTQIDGLRVASPEANRRVVPLDILPAALVDHVVVQKTYTADRPGEFGGGDVQVVTKDFPGREVFTLSVSQGYEEGTTWRRYRTYAGSGDWLGFGVADRDLPHMVEDMAASKRIIRRGLDPSLGFPLDSLAALARSFSNAWSPTLSSRAVQPSSVSQTYGNEYTVFGRPLGLVQSLSWGLSTESVDQIDRDFRGAEGAQLYDYAVTKWTETARLAGLSALSYRLGAGHTLHARGLYSRTGEDEVTSYTGFVNANNRNLRGTSLAYIARTIGNASLQGKHELPFATRPKVEWQASLSKAVRDEPDRRETLYEGYQYLDDDDSLQTVWSLSGSGVGATRYFGHMEDDGQAVTASITLPFTQRGLSKLTIGGGTDVKDRLSIYRRLLFVPRAGDQTAIPESLFAPSNFTGRPGGAEVKEITRPDDSYAAHQEFTSAFVSADLAIAHGVRGVFGARLEHGIQDVSTYDLFHPGAVPVRGLIDHVDVLPSVNVTVAATERSNIRIAAARTISRPDLRELTPGPTFEILGHLPVIGNPKLRRASLANYDVRYELFPAPGEVLACGTFYKRFVHPIEYIVLGGDTPVLQPRNSKDGRNYGLEVELRSTLGRVHPRLSRFFLNANATLLSSEIALQPTTSSLGSSDSHPLEGQAPVLCNVALSYANASSTFESTISLNHIGRRLTSLGLKPLPDQYTDPLSIVDVTASWRLSNGMRLKLSGKNLTDQKTISRQGDDVNLEYRTGRSVSLGATLGQ